ncbi:hypothetical protein R83H12_01306 [Fibrobacteria bacterium R8-3-H12]
MEQDDYIRRAMFRTDQREQLRYAEDKGEERYREKILELIGKGYSLTDIEKFCTTKKADT